MSGNFPGGHGEGNTYWAVSYIEVFIPLLFFLIFTLLLNGVSVYYPDKFYFTLLAYCPTVCGLVSEQLWGVYRGKLTDVLEDLKYGKKESYFGLGLLLGLYTE